MGGRRQCRASCHGGAPLTTYFLVPFSHVDPESGLPVYIDIEGNETFEYNLEDRRAVGDGLPDHVGGLRNEEVGGQGSARHSPAVVGAAGDGVFGEITGVDEFVVVVGVVQDGFPLQGRGARQVVGSDAHFPSTVQDLTCIDGAAVEAGVGGKFHRHEDVAGHFVVPTQLH